MIPRLHNWLTHRKMETDFPPTQWHRVGAIASSLTFLPFLLCYAAPLVWLALDNPLRFVAENTAVALGVVGIGSVMIIDICVPSHLKKLGLNLLALCFLSALNLVYPELELKMAELLVLLNEHRVTLTSMALLAVALWGFLSLMKHPLQNLIDRLFGLWAKEWEAQGYMSKATRFTWFDKRSISIHEAGHAVVMALDPFLDDSAEVVLAQGPDRGSFGYCRHNGWPHNVLMREYMQMRMIGMLAGVEAERLMLGGYGSGGAADFRNWLARAPQFMATDPDDVYFTSPTGLAEIELNRLTLNEVRKKHQDQARRILEANKPILEEIAAKLVEKNRLHGAELREILSRVVSIEGVPDFSRYLEWQKAHQKA